MSFDESKDSLGPFAWQFTPNKRLRSTANTVVPENVGCSLLPVQCDKPAACGTDPVNSKWKDSYLGHPDLANLPRSMDVFRKIERDVNLSLQLPRAGSTPGRVLQHSVSLFEALLSKHQPMTFKFGITHDAAVRWHNTKFGYKYSKDPFSHMIIIYAAANPHGPAFLEAMLIDRFGSFLFAKRLPRLLVQFFYICRSCKDSNDVMFSCWGGSNRGLPAKVSEDAKMF